MNSNGKTFDSIDALCDDIERNYINSKIDNTSDGKYSVVSVGEGTIESIIKRLGNFSRTEIVYLILEKNDG